MKAFSLKKLQLRKALLALTMASACALPLSFPTVSMAAAPAQQQTQVPGYYRMALSDFEVTAIYDGYVKLGTNLLKDINLVPIY